MTHFEAMLLAELDLGQIIIIVIAVVAGFIQWLWKLIKQGQEERERRSQLPEDPEEKRLRDEAWRRQVQQSGPRPAPTATPPPINDPWSSVREVFDKMKEEMRKAQEEQTRPAVPPPLPSRPATPPPVRRPVPGTVRAELHPQVARPAPTPPPVPTSAPLPSVVTSPVASVDHHQGPELGALRSLLFNPASLRQAVLLREILGPPKALQSSGDSPI